MKGASDSGPGGSNQSSQSKRDTCEVKVKVNSTHPSFNFTGQGVV